MTTITLFAMRLLDRARDEKGQGLVEYALILALISIVAITILGTIGTDIVTKLTSVADAI